MTHGEKEERTMAVLALVVILVVAYVIGRPVGMALPWPLAGLLAAGAAVANGTIVGGFLYCDRDIWRAAEAELSGKAESR